VIVVLDACVLYPPSLRDLLLTLAALDAFEVRWSDEILDEVTRNVVADHPDIDAVRFVEHTVGAMRRAFPEASVQASAELAETLDNDPKDRHVAATALAADADAIVTLNVADFESRVLSEASVEILTPGALVGRILDEFPDVVADAVDHIADRWTNPSMTAREITELLAAHPTMKAPMAALRERVERE
jgi:predicted nucleic acid-binding protein